jgi:hypothetical protein
VSMGETGRWANFLQEADTTNMPNRLETQRLHCECTHHYSFISSRLNTYCLIQRPEGRLRSAFIIELAQAYLRFVNGAVGERGHPVGLFALILAAVRHFVIPSESQLTASRHRRIVRAGCLCLCQWGTKRRARVFWQVFCRASCRLHG